MCLGLLLVWNVVDFGLMSYYGALWLLVLWLLYRNVFWDAGCFVCFDDYLLVVSCYVFVRFAVLSG